MKQTSAIALLVLAIASLEGCSGVSPGASSVR